MIKINIKNRAKAAWNTTKIVAKKHGPKAAIVAGVVCLVAGTVVACIRAQDIPEIVDEAKEYTKSVKELVNNGKYDEDIGTELIVKSWARCGYRIAAKLWPVFALEGVGVLLVAKGWTATNTALGAANAALMAKLEEQNELEKRILNAYGPEALDKLKYGEPITINELEEGATEHKVYDDDIHQFDFIFGEGMGDFNPNNESMNLMIVKNIIEGYNMSTQKYGVGTTINTIYRAFDKTHPKALAIYEKNLIGFPVTKGADNSIRYHVEWLDGTTRPGKTARDMRVIFDTVPVPMEEIMIEQNFLRRSYEEH